jgi:2-octaprenyl-6-methoxyphenol hydroxylase
MTSAASTTALVAGGGPAALVTACLLAQSGVETLCIAPADRPDPRTTALMEPALRLLRHIGVWTDELTRHCAPLRQLHLRDDTGHLLSAPDLNFSARELQLDAFGWNTPLANLVPALRARAQALGATLLTDTVTTVHCGADTIEVTTQGGHTITARFAVAGDGRDSLLRKAAGIVATPWSFEQAALVTRFSHSADHEGVSTEWHKQGGPFTTVPLPGLQSALVWMDVPTRIGTLMQQDLKLLARDIQLQGHGTLGLVHDVQPPASFPMQGLRAANFAARRVFLVGEAAHVFPPVGAQGLNMSMRDAGHLLDVVMAHEDPASSKAMAEYDALRRPDVLPRQTAISLMNRSLLATLLPPHIARSAGLAAVATLPPLRNLALREGLAPSHGLPFVMRPA